jgi:hypothetical protein
MAQKMFPLERLFAASDELMRISKRLSKKNSRDAIAMLLLSAATVACVNDFSKQEFLRGVELAWRTAEGAAKAP